MESLEVPIAFGGVRQTWLDLPAALRARIERRLGAPVVDERSARGGFSPGLASVLTTSDGRRAFVKVAHATEQETAARFHRREAEVLAGLPMHLPVPRLLWVDDDGEWVVVASEALDGASPGTPWSPDALASALAALEQVAEVVPAGALVLEAAPDAVRGLCDGWACLRDDPDPMLRQRLPWAADRLDELADLERRGPDATVGDRLLHFDVRADNLVVAQGRTWVVDWAHAVRGAAWADLVTFLPSVGMQGMAGRTAPLVGAAGADHRRAVGELLAHTFAGSRDGAAADPADVRAFLTGIAGFFLNAGRLAPVPGIPNLRPFQRAQGVAAVAWLEVLDG